MKIAIGTAQFGIPYGIANKNGRVAYGEVEKILSIAQDNKVDTIDTAMSYGNSEEVLGNFGVKNFKVITKLPEIPLNSNINIRDWILKQVENSLKKLQTDKIYGLLLHSPNQAYGEIGEKIFNTLFDLKSEKIANKIGISIYNPKDLDYLIANYTIDIVQAPFNLIDRRIIETGWLEKLYQLSIELHTRSSFLQGLLLFSRNDIPPEFELWSKIWDRWNEYQKLNKISAIELAFKFCLLQEHVNRVVVGVDNCIQFKELINISNNCSIIKNWPKISSNNEKLINPSEWKKL
jgi:hypothetical protein